MNVLAAVALNRPLIVDVLASAIVGFLAAMPFRRHIVCALAAALGAITSLVIFLSWLLGELRHPFSLREYVPGIMFVLVPLCVFYYAPAVIGAGLSVLLSGRRSSEAASDAPRNV